MARHAAQTRVRARLGKLELETSIFAPGSADEAWDVVTDYDQLGNFMPNLESRQTDRTAGGVLVRQVGTSSLSRRVRFQFVLEFERRDASTLRFRQVVGNLRKYEGSWRVTPTSGGVRIAYQAVVTHGFPIAGRILASLVRTDIEKIMPAIVAEMQRRAPRQRAFAT